MIEKISRCFQLSHLFLMTRGTTPIARVGCIHCLELLVRSRSHSVLHLYRRSLSTSHQIQAGSRWRDSQGQSQSGRDYGPLIDLPDWSYADGRPAPQGSGQLRRQQEQRHIAERIDRLAAEMIGAVQREKDALKAEQRKQHETEQHKLKTKVTQEYYEPLQNSRLTKGNNKNHST